MIYYSKSSFLVFHPFFFLFNIKYAIGSIPHEFIKNKITNQILSFFSHALYSAIPFRTISRMIKNPRNIINHTSLS
jgi:hypothetical protein